MIVLRELNVKDAPLMLEWMHDPVAQKGLRKELSSMSLQDAEKFCLSSALPETVKQNESIHFAIVESDDDEYLGTISLKNIDLKNQTAEFAIVLREKARGLHVARKATEAILSMAFGKYGLNRVFLSVLEDNYSAIRLYERCGFIYEGTFRHHIFRDGEFLDWKWYGILKSEYEQKSKDF